MNSFTKLMSDYGMGSIIAAIVIAYAIYLFFGYLTNKSHTGAETMEGTVSAQYKKSGDSSNVPQPSQPLGHNEDFAQVKGIVSPQAPSSSAHPNIQNPDDLLPKDTKSEWAHLNPSGKGELNNINLLKAGHQIGIDTVGQSLRNANLQLRSEPANPQLYVGPWNMSTIEPDFMRPPMEIGQGKQ